jgi:hypothetical protein
LIDDLGFNETDKKIPLPLQCCRQRTSNQTTTYPTMVIFTDVLTLAEPTSLFSHGFAFQQATPSIPGSSQSSTSLSLLAFAVVASFPRSFQQLA